MQLIVDSGSSKTDWRTICLDGKIEQFKTSGINSYLITEEQLFAKLQMELEAKEFSNLDEIHFYGAGCKNSKNKAKVKSVLSKYFDCNQIFIEDDMLAAARACCGTEEGIVCILGTGANACHYKNGEIKDQMTSLGYTIGDEGSGAYIGKMTLKAFLENELPLKLMDKFKTEFPGLQLEEALENIYQKPYPNRYLAQFFPFALANQKEKFFFDLITNAFQLFLEKSVFKFNTSQKLPIHFIGGVAYNANSLIRMVLSKNNLVAGNFIESPIAGLTLYHKKHNS